MGLVMGLSIFNLKMNTNNIINLARISLENYFKGKQIISSDKIDQELINNKAGVFVSLHKNGKLRGCIGTFEPTQDSIASEIIRNAIESAHDPRFLPL